MQRLNTLAGLAGAMLLAMASLPGGIPPALAAEHYVMATNDTAPVAALRDVVRRANEEQAQALSQGDPSVMKDTATAGYYARLVQVNDGLKANGVSSIELLDIQWGPIRLLAGDRATAVTNETWRTTFADGTVRESQDLNVYTLVRQDGAWKVAADLHPDSEIQIPAPGRPATPGRQSSLNWSGYQATGGAFTSVSGTWTVPSPDPSTEGADAAWVGIGGVTSNDLIQAGTEETVTRNGQVRYQAWIELLPRPSTPVPLAVHSGDSVTVSLAQQAPGRWQISMTNNTTGQNYQRTVDYDSSLSSAEWVEEAPSGRRGIVPLNNFGSVAFNKATAVKNGQTVTLAQAGAQPITMIDQAGRTLAAPSAVGPDGASFSVSRSSTPTTVTGPGLVVAPVGPVMPRVPSGRGGGIWIELFGG